MKRLVVFSAIFLFAAVIIGGVYFYNSDPAKAWTIQGDTYCHKRHAICLENKPRWMIQFPLRFQNVRYLLSLRKEIPGGSGFSEIVVSSPDSLIKDHVRITNPSTYLQMSVNPLRREYFKFEELQPPVNELLNGREVAKGRFLVMRLSSDRPIMALDYAFISSDRGGGIVYFASPDQYEKNLAEAMDIIKSFKFGKEAVKDEKSV